MPAMIVAMNQQKLVNFILGVVQENNFLVTEYTSANQTFQLEINGLSCKWMLKIG